jgi:hypothetical protein
MLALMAAALAPRLLWFSGYGLDDDGIFRGNIAFAMGGGSSGDNISFRVTWLALSALSCRLFGLTETGMIAPITTLATLGVGIVYAIGKLLWGRAGAVVAALLLAALPLDFAWSTMLTNDVVLSFFSGLTMLFVLRALVDARVARPAWCWALAALAFWLAILSKITAILLAPAIAMICLLHRDRVGRAFAWFVLPAGGLLAATVLSWWWLRGDPLAPYHAELAYQGLVGPEAAAKRFTAADFWFYPKLLFAPDRWGDVLFGIYPHVLVGLALASRMFGIRSSVEIACWLGAVLLGMQANVHRTDDLWVSGFRNARHGHVLAYPVVLLLAGFLVDLHGRRPRFAIALAVLSLASGAWFSVRAAEKTHESFGDMRGVCRIFAALPPKPVVSDALLPPVWCQFMTEERGWRFTFLSTWNPRERAPVLAAATSGYVVTGGGREPRYGCHDCIIRAAELAPDRWRLVAELEAPIPPRQWRPEALRVWEAREP